MSIHAGQQTQYGFVFVSVPYIVSAEQISSYCSDKHIAGIFSGIVCIVAFFEPVHHEFHYTIMKKP